MYKVRDMLITSLGHLIPLALVHSDHFICVAISINWFEFKFIAIFLNSCITVGKCARLGSTFSLSTVEMFLFKLYIFLDFLHWEHFKHMPVFEFKETTLMQSICLITVFEVSLHSTLSFTDFTDRIQGRSMTKRECIKCSE